MTEQSGSAEPRLGRRDFLVAGSAILGGGAVSAGIAATASGADDVAYVAARVVAHPNGKALELTPAGTAAVVSVELAPGGKAVHADRTVDLSAYNVGDLVVVDIPGQPGGHIDFDGRGRGRQYLAAQASDCRIGTYATRGEPVT